MTYRPAIGQTGFVFAVVGFAWVFYITTRGDLPKWLGLLGLAGGSSKAPTASQGGTTISGAGLPALPGLATIPALPGVSAIPTGGL